MRILFVGDVFSKLGRKALEVNIKRIKENDKINFIVVNGENISHGKGMNEGHYYYLLSLGVNVVTLGNHSFQQKSLYNIIDDAKCLVRPYNYIEEQKGVGYLTINYNGTKITVIQMLGTVFMAEVAENPFIKTKELLEKLDSDIYIIDFHAESTSEKIAFGYAFDGKVQAIIGTHTHVQTSDERILPNGTAYITDVGMTGPLEGVIGVKKEIIVNRYIDDIRSRFEPEDNGLYQFNAVIIDIDEKTHKATKIDRIHIVE